MPRKTSWTPTIIEVPFPYFEMIDSFASIRDSYDLFVKNRKALEKKELNRLSKQIGAMTFEDDGYKNYLLQNKKRSLGFAIPQVQAFSTIIMLFSAFEYWVKRLADNLLDDLQREPTRQRFQGNAHRAVQDGSEGISKAVTRKPGRSFSQSNDCLAKLHSSWEWRLGRA